MRDGRRGHQEVRRQLQVSVVLHQPGKLEVLGDVDTVELVKLRSALEGLGDLNHAVRAEVEDDDRVIVLHLPDWRAGLIDYNKGVEVLVVGAGVGLELGDQLGSDGAGDVRLAQHVRLPPALHHLPLCLVTVHCNLHAAAAGRDARVAAGRRELGELGLERLDEGDAGAVGHVPAVSQHVAPDPLRPVRRRALDHRRQLVGSRVHPAVRQQPNEVDGVGAEGGRDVLPARVGEDLARLDVDVHQLGALRVDLAGAKRVVPNLGVTHVVP
mmetsp:Transcript_24664/g.79634  ORF Transcript_24664/g.79634 Transcript_24664/m.79634 type:complete len:269 (+) Transcript_24664:1169-1975(+)